MNDPAIPPAFILGGGLTTLGILRSLGRRGIASTVFTNLSDDITSHSRFARTLLLPEPDDPQAVADYLIAEARTAQSKPVLFVSGDRQLLTACRQLDRLREHLHVLLPPQAAAETVVDKTLFRAFAEQHAAPVPRTWSPSSEKELIELIPHLPFPLVLKPAQSADWRQDSIVAVQGWIKMIRVDDPETLLREWARVSNLVDPPIVQEFIRGDDSDHFSYVSYMNRDGVELAGLCVRKLRVHPIHGGAAACATIFQDTEMEAAGRSILRQLGYRSVASVCFKRDPETGQARIYEINGRIPLCHGIFQLAGIDLPWLMYRDAQGLASGACGPTQPRGHWMALDYDIAALREYRRAGELSYGDWIRSLLKVRHIVEFDPRDLGPFIHVIKNKLRSGGKKLMGTTGH